MKTNKKESIKSQIAQILFWITISITLIVIHVFFVFISKGIYWDNMYSYITGALTMLIVVTTTIINAEPILKRNSAVYSWYVSITLRTWWYWVDTILMGIFLALTFWFLGQLFMDKEDVFETIPLGVTHPNLCTWLFIAGIVGTAITMIYTQKKMKKFAEE